MIQANATLVALRRARLLLLLVVPLVVLVLWSDYNLILGLSQLPSIPPSSLSTLVVAPLQLVFFAGTLVIIFLLGRYWQRIEQRRMLAVQGDQRLLAADQPQPNIPLLRPPLSIQLRYGWRGALLLVPAAIVILGGLSPNSLSFVAPAFFQRLTLAGWLIHLFVGALWLIALAILVVAFSRQVRQQLDATGDGLTARSMGQTSTVHWHEARLFARYATFGTQRSGDAITYELSSATDIVRWTWVRRRTFLEPTLPLDEYARQEEALLSLVAAKTGLALYDLSRNRS